MPRRQARLKKLVGLFLSAGMLLSMLPAASAATAEKESAIKNVAANQTYKTIGKVTKITKEKNNVYLDLETGEKIKINFLKNNVFRLHLDPKGNFEEYPTPNKPEHETKIIDKSVSDYKKQYGDIDIKVNESDKNVYKIATDALELRVDKITSKMSLYDKKRSKILWSESEPLKHSSGGTIQTLDTKENEYFYGGGQQNGFYAHKNNSIKIAIGGGWDAGAASSPVPFYLSTEGYGVMRNTFKPGVYDFAKTATFTHNEDRFDAYYFVDNSIPKVINEYTELTGKPALMPKYGFYLGHADCFNGTHNGHKDQRTLLTNGLNTVKQYVEKDMPLGWFLPNDGYGCGYGGLDNLKQFVDKTNDQKVEVGLWTQSNLYPDPNLPEDSPLRRDLEGEVKAGVRAIKTDVAWVGQGYSMALNATRQAAEGIEKYSGGARPFVITVDGWAGTQRYSTLWSGDQYGGNWEYIRMHIPTYIGAGLSGNPNIGSDMDGIFGGESKVQTRDFQWKAFTPIQIDMDGWASGGTDYSKSKNPWNYGEPYASINRMYLKLKAQMMPYNYTIAEESSRTSMPMVRGMMLEYPNDPNTYGTETQYQYMWGPNLLVAPVYDGDSNAAEVRNNIYLPDKNQVWIDYFTGEQYQGGSVLHNFSAPLWKTPVFVKAGAIIPMAPENNSINELDGSENRIFDIYPSGNSKFTLYEDDGKTVEYKDKKSTRTVVTSSVTGKNAVILVNNTTGKGYKGMVKNRGTEAIVNTRVKPNALTVKVGNKNVKLKEVKSEEAYKNSENVYYYNERPNLNKYSTKGSSFEKTDIITTPKLYIKVGKTDIIKNKIIIMVHGFDNTQKKDVVDKEVPKTPSGLKADDANITDRDIKLNWDKVDGSTVTYDLMINGVVHTNVFKPSDGGQAPFYLHSGLTSDTEYSYRIRATNTKGSSGWSDEVKIRTKLDRYRNVPKNMTAKADSQQPGQEASLAVDGKDETLWHTKWGDEGSKLPHTFEIDMKLAYELDKFEYVPRPDAGNGTILKYNLDVSLDGKTYKNVITDGIFERNNKTKVIEFKENVTARYIKLTITSAVGNHGSAQEFRPYKKDKTEGTVVGENIPNGKIDEEDLLFFASYMGVDQSDTAWGQVSKVDINFNGVIDAYDLMYVASQLDQRPLQPTGRPVAGQLDIRPSKQQLKAGEEFTVDIIGAGLKDINALNLELPLDPNKYEIVKQGENVVSSANETAQMLNYSALAGIGNAKQRIMAAFSNKGTQPTLEGTKTLAKVKLKAKQDLTFDMPITRSLLVNTAFHTIDKIGKVLNPGEEPGEVEQPQEPKVLQLSNRDMTVSGPGEMMQGGAAAFAKLIDGVINENSLAELKWNLTEQDGISLPLPVDFNFTKPQELRKFIVYNRPQYTNGKIKKLSAKGYTEAGKEYNLGTKTVASNDKSVTFDLADAQIPVDTKFTKFSINFEESHSGPLMLSVAEVEVFVENPAYEDNTRLLSENFDGLRSILQPAADEQIDKSILGWTHLPPEGWSIINNPKMPKGVAEWQGWSFATKEFWTSADKQKREEFDLGKGVVAIADSDEWDDLGSPSSSGTFDSTLVSPNVKVTGGQTLYLSFATHYLQEANEKALVTATFDNGDELTVLRYDKNSDSDNAGKDVLNNQVLRKIQVPKGAKSMTLKWRYYDAGNNWFWAIDDIRLGSDQTINYPDPPTKTTWVSDLNWISAENNWGPVERDKSNGESAAGDGGPITLDGVTYGKGLGVHAPSKVSYYLGGKASRFISDIGVDDEIPDYGSVVFQVFADGKKIYDSGVMTGTSDTKQVHVDIKGVDILELVVTNAGDGNSGDHADWAGARFIIGDDAGTVPVLTLKGDDPLIVEVGSKYTDPGVEAYDEHDGDLTKQVIVEHRIDTSKPGTYEVKYSVKNSSGFIVTKKRKVWVVDSKANDGLDLSFSVISDFQLTLGNSGTVGPKIVNALQQLYAINPNSDAMVVPGDMVNDGSAKSYAKVNEYMNKAPHPDNLFYGIGNHEFFSNDGNEPSIGRFLDFTGLDRVYYERMVKGFPFIMLGTESWGPVGSPTKDSADLSKEQIQWLKETLKKHEKSNKPIFVFLHNPLPYTLTGTDLDYYAKGVLQDKELKEILSQYPQVILFSAHMHWDLAIPGMFKKDGFSMANSGSVYNTYGPDGRGGETVLDSNGSQGLYVQVYGDKVIINGRDFAKKEWIKEYKHVIPYGDKKVDK